MKKIIDGRIYDTDKAQLIGDIGGDYGDRLNSWSESLYRKRNGEYFFHGEGGPNTKYSRQISANNWSGGEEIKPLTYAEARAWAEKHLDPDIVIEHFSIADDDSRGKIAVNLSLSASIADRARIAASEAGRNLSSYIESLIKDALHITD